MLMSHRDMDQFGFNYQSGHKILERMSDSYQAPVEMRNGLPFLLFETVGFFSTSQLRAMHRNLGHPTIEKQMKILETAGVKDLSADTRKVIESLTKQCKHARLKKAKPRRYLFSLRDDVTGEFNHTLEIDVVCLQDGNVLHTICSGTGFQQGRFLNDMSAAEAWNTLRRCWINVFAGAPDYIQADAGTNFTAKEFRNAADDMGIVLKVAPTEGHERIGKVERAHAILRAVYDKLKIDKPSMSREDRLSLAFRAINDSPSNESGISPTALVFGVHPKLPGSSKRGSYAQRAKIVAECTKLATEMKAKTNCSRVDEEEKFRERARN